MSGSDKTLRERIHYVLSDERSPWFFPVNNVIAAVIIFATVIVILETVQPLFETYSRLFIVAEMVVLTIFTIEYVLRIWSSPNPVRYMTSFFGIIDFLSIIPGLFLILLPNAITYHTLGIIRILRVLRLLRTFRLVRLAIPKRHRERMSRQFHNSITLINFEIYVFALVMVVVFSGTLMYIVEGGLPNSHFSSIPDGLWWAVVTISTVGYGDLVPISALGKIIATATMFAGLGLFVLMLTVVGRVMQVILFGTTIDDRTKGF